LYTGHVMWPCCVLPLLMVTILCHGLISACQQFCCFPPLYIETLLSSLLTVCDAFVHLTLSSLGMHGVGHHEVHVYFCVVLQLLESSFHGSLVHLFSAASRIIAVCSSWIWYSCVTLYRVFSAEIKPLVSVSHNMYMFWRKCHSVILLFSLVLWVI
jgi:hypothetical protein